MKRARDCDTCEGELPPGSEGDTSPECLRTILAGAMPDDEAEDDWEHPDECDYYTQDDTSCEFMHFREYGTGKHLLSIKPDETDGRRAVHFHMDRERFWPNVWFLSDHGNWRLFSLNPEKRWPPHRC